MVLLIVNSFMGRLEGKVAIVTGASRGIGEGIARMLAKEGASVILTARSDKVLEKAEEMRIEGYRAFGIRMDVSEASQVNRIVKQVLKKFGKIDILVNNAGIYPSALFLETTEKMWNEVFNVNLKGVVHCTKAVLPNMMERRSGKIINISSVTGPMVSGLGTTAYSASKGAVSAFTRALALDVASYSINVNAICPGTIYTPGLERTAKDAGQSPEKVAEDLALLVPLKRLGAPEEVGQLAVFLASEESNYITGTEIVIDGGNIIQETKT